MKKIVVIVGPTASGKSALAIEVAQKFDGEIISADSMQIYKQLDVGTAKESNENRKKIQHYLLDIVEPNQEFSVAQWKDMAHKSIEEIWQKGKVPIVVGGTGLYIESLLFPYSFSKSDKSEEIREKLEKQIKDFGNEFLYEKLKKIDPKSAQKIHLNDTKRIVRALEIFETTGKTKTENADKNLEMAYDAVFVGLNGDRAKIYENINSRVDKMINSGLLKEIDDLQKQSGTNIWNWQSMQAIGYKEFKDFDGTNLDEIADKIKLNTRHYAKRQLTWFRKYKNLNWFDRANMQEALEYIEQNLTS